MGLLDRVGCRTDEAVLHFSILHARDAAWGLAATLVTLRTEDADRELLRVDEWTAVLAQLIRTPGVSGSAAALLIRLTELRGVHRVLDDLS